MPLYQNLPRLVYGVTWPQYLRLAMITDDARAFERREEFSWRSGESYFTPDLMRRRFWEKITRVNRICSIDL